MKNFTRLKLAFTALSLTFLGACSPTMYTFTPNTGGYHGQESKKTEVAAREKAVTPEAVTLTAATNPEPVTQPATETAITSQKLAQNLVAKTTPVNAQAVTEKSETSQKHSLKALRKDMKQLKKDIKNGKGDQGLGLSSNVKLLLILGLAFLLVGALLNIGIIYLIGGILLIIGLVLFLMEIL